MKRLLSILLAVSLLLGAVPQRVMAKSIKAAETTDTWKKERIKAQEKVVNIINTYADPDYFMKFPYQASTSDKEWIELCAVAEGAIDEAKTQYDKIKALTFYVANLVYYDFKVYRRESDYVYISPYDVYKHRLGVCAGYANLMEALCYAVGIPCMRLTSYDHAYNAAYDSEQKRWIFVDATWSSRNSFDEYRDGKYITGEAVDFYFDMTPEDMAGGHPVYYVEGLLDKKHNAVHYRLGTHHDELLSPEQDWEKTERWYLSVTDAVKKDVKIVSELDGIPVTEVMGSSIKSEDKKTLRTLDLTGASVKKISDRAFVNCKELTDVKFPSTLTDIDDSAFSQCCKLKTIDLSGTRVTNIGKYAFSNCSAAKTIKLPNTVKTFGKCAFYNYEYSKKARKNVSNIKTTLITKLSRKQLGIDDKKKRIWEGRKIVNFESIYTIRFMTNGAKSGKMPDLICDRDSYVTLPANKFKRPGYKFNGWSTKKNGNGKLYKNRAKIKNLAEKNKTIKLYACWEKVKKKSKK